MQATPRVPQDERWYAALSARDARFDGRFWFGVTTTGIYCRPVCAARTPGRDRVRFFESPAAASSAGFRPCKRCVPARSTQVASVDVREHVATGAVRRIERGALAGGRRVGDLAAEFGIGERQLRRVVQSAYGTTVSELARSARLRLATTLLAESNLSVTEVAFASGYGSLRRFNAEFLQRNGRPPREVRRRGRSADAGTFELRIAYREPFAWEALLGWFGRHALPGAEVIDQRSYARTVRIGGHVGWLRVRPDAQHSRLVVECAQTLLPVVGDLTERVRRAFDLDARADVIDALLARDGELAPDVEAEPGIRVPGSLDSFEPAWRGVVGQQVSVAAANTVGGRLCAQFGEPLQTPIDGLDRVGPEPRAFAEAPLEALRTLGLTGVRAESLRTLAAAVAADDTLMRPETMDPQRLLALPGIGPWTVTWIELRAFSNPDAFPTGDLVLRRVLGVATDRELLERAEAWRPWRAYAAIRLWNRAAARAGSTRPQRRDVTEADSHEP